MVKRPIVIACIGYVLGIIYGLYFIKLSIAIIIIIIISISLILYSFFNNRFIKILIPKNAVILFCIFFIVGGIYIYCLNQKYTKIYGIDKEIKVEGIVTKVEEKEYSNRYRIIVKKINNKKCKDIKFLMYTKKNDYTLKYGDYIEVMSEYVQPEDSRNFKGFSYKDYLKQCEIYGTIIPTSLRVKKENQCNLVYMVANNIRNIIIDNVNKNLSNEAGNVFLGILLGEKSQISDEINSYFKDSNMAHILAVSGAHVSYVILTITILLNKAGKKVNIVTTIMVLIFFMILANFTASVVRACVMAIIALVSKIVHKKSDIYNNLAISCLLILLNNPYNVLNVGFQLSFLGTLGIVLLNKKIKQKVMDKRHNMYRLNKAKEYILNTIIISVCVQLLIAPIMLINFNTLSLNFLISGLVSTPIFAGIMIIGIITLITGELGIYLFPILKILINILIFTSKFISNIPFLKIRLTTPNPLWIISYYILFIAIIFFNSEVARRIIKNKNKKDKLIKKVVIIMLIICILVQGVQDFRFKELIIYFIDVGQGDSTLIITPLNKTILVDGGGSSKDNYDVGKNILVPYLLDRRINKIDYIMVSHFDNDHCGGLMYVLETIKVKNILISEQANISEEYKTFMQVAKEKNINIILVKQGDLVVIEKDIQLNILYPSIKLEFDDLNNNSIVAKLVYKNFSMLFAGDVEKEAENKLVEKYSENILKSTVLKVAHHGSKSSSTEAFVKLVNPKIALIGVGKDNTFGHPNSKVIERIENIGAKVYRTDKCGEISIKVNKKRTNVYFFKILTIIKIIIKVLIK